MAKKDNKRPKEELLERDDIENKETESASNGITEVWKFFSSMKLGLILLLIIAAVAIVGTLMPVDPQTNLPTFNVYNQIWFRGLLGLLCMNLLVCSLNRWKFIVRSIGIPKVKVSENYLKKQKLFSSVRKKATLAEMGGDLEAALHSRGYRVFREDEDGVTYLAADKGRYGVFGSFTTHLAFIVIVIGAIYGGFTGYEGFVNAPEGQTFSLVRDVQWSTVKKPSASDDFDVRVNKFTMETYPDGSPKAYYSDLTVIDQGREVLSKRIRVNDPLQYKGVKFYQSSFGPANNVTVRVVNKKDGQSQDYLIGEQNGAQFAGTDLGLQVIKFIPDFDPSNPEQSKSDLPNNPAVAYALYKGNQQIDTGYKLLNTPLENEEATITFTGYHEGYYTGLSVRKDPGVPIVWLGCGLLVLGMLISFFMQHRKVWAVVKEANGIAIADVGAVTEKNKLGMENDYEAIIETLKN